MTTILIGPETQGQAHPEHHATLPAVLADVALIDARICASAGRMSVSWWHEKVAAGEAPQPVVRSHRCTRWRASDVALFWLEFAKLGGAKGDALVANAKRASAASKAKRAASPVRAGASS
jgi:predicted DNA-binding transcriptional regulator AlpA